jgi:hypothetical protein
VAALVWLGFVAARLVFPERKFLQFAVPALLAFLPQSAFYSIQNDVLSPLCFGAAFICAIKFMRAETPDLRLGAVTGLAFAATFLAKITNLPLLAMSALAVAYKIIQLARAGKLRAAAPAALVLVGCAALPIAGWLAWCKHVFGNFTGSAAKVALLNWTLKPFGEWWHHPIFTPHGLWIFISGLLATFWQGELEWHRQPLAWPLVDLIYALASIGLIGVAGVTLLSRSAAATASQRRELAFGFACCLAAVAFLGFLSIIYDFGDCPRPSREIPFFTSGRMVLGALIPFLLLFVYGLDRALSRMKINWLQPLLLTTMILCMLIFEAAINWPVFSSQYNWFHL